MTHASPYRSGALSGAPFTELFRQVKDAGLLALRPGYYAWRLTLNAALCGAGLAAFLLLGASWWQLAVAVYLALCSVQCAFMGHDAGHKAMFRDKRAATAVGLIHLNLVNGISYGWWVNHHNRHHSHPNHIDRDPDIARRTAVFHVKQYATRNARQRFIVRHQAVLFFVLLVLEAYKIQKTSVLAVVRGVMRRPLLEGALLLAHAVVFLGTLFLVLPPLHAVAFLLVHQAATGVYLGLVFAPNHKGMAVREGEEEALDWLERQVLTSRNVRPSVLTDFLYGGLNYQIEHHLFPAMPQRNLGRCRKIVRRYCVLHGLPYRELGFAASYREVAGFLHEVSAPMRADQERAGRHRRAL
ncbi:fatty acid desaturase family protein [Streptomyces violens]|uniref:fatty acid desaturase family protein n=1 Tax=Streptomyces violens TaxID=66377 RepID=UPI00068CA9F4|nr:acyl-CoA desaturase [Streptomyces violens]